MRPGTRITKYLVCSLGASVIFISLSCLGFQLLSDVLEIPFQSLANLDNFAFLMGGDHRSICPSSKPVKLLMLVHSAPQNRDRRDVIRKTWASLAKTKALFLVGVSPEHQSSLNKENYEHKDIVQGNFLDTYKNLSYKHLMGLAWAVTFCPIAKTILKVDDDTFVDTYRLFDVLDSLKSLRNTIVCAVFQSGSSPMRIGVRRVTHREYAEGKTYPKYCSGMAYVTSVHVAERLVKQSRLSNFFWVDDVYVTGLLAAECGVSHKNWIRWYSDVFSRDVLSWLSDESDRKPVPYMFVELREKPSDWTKIMNSLWNKTKKSWNNVDV